MLRKTLPVLAAVAALALPAAAAQAADSTLAVVGNGSAFVTPDTADISASVEKTTTSAEASREDVAQRTNGLLAALDRLGVARADITTTSVSVNRQTYKKRPKVRYVATSSLSIHLTDATKAGPVLDALTAAQADNVDGPNFGFSDPSAGMQQAEAAALADARKRADAAASAVGMHVSGVQQIDLDPGSGISPFARETADTTAASAPAPAKATPTPVQNGRQQVTTSVAVVFLISA
jgi:uncharacterized protein